SSVHTRSHHESLAQIGGPPSRTVKSAPIAHARTCYDHLAGRLGVDLEAARQERRRFATACLDWTERRPHLGGALGAAVWAELVSRGWIVRRPGTRAVVVTAAGTRGLRRTLGVTLGGGPVGG